MLDDGKITERGTHIKLLAQRGLYSRLWAQQEKEEKESIATLDEGMLDEK